MDAVDKQLSTHKFVIIPTNRVGCLKNEYDAKGNLREEAVGITITDTSEMIYADDLSIRLGAENER